jgi:Cu/Ag efflux protein CusF
MKMSRAVFLGTSASALLAFSALAGESRSGNITRLDEASGTIAISEPQAVTTGSSAAGASHEFKLRDGLMYNAFKEGDRIFFTVEESGGTGTVTKIEKQ